MSFFLPKLSLLFLHLLLIIILQSPATNSDLLWKVCSTDSNYIANSTSGSNLNNLLLPSLSAAPPNGSSYETKGQPPDQAYGLALCRGDVSTNDCRTCLDTSINDTVQQYCLHPARFNQLLGGLMSGLSTRAAYRSSRMFATGEADFTSFQKIYGLVQCTKDLTGDTCYRCLQAFVGFILHCCAGKQGGRVIESNCQLRYEIYPFYNVIVDDLSSPPLAPPPSTAPSPPSPAVIGPPPSNTTGEGGKSDNTTKTVLIIVLPVVATLVLLSAIGIYLRRRKKTVRRIPNAVDDEDFRSSESQLFDLSTLRAATNNFCDANKLGEGGFGPVYKGSLQDGQEIAVKRLSSNSVQGLVELRNEVVLVAKLQHRNLVRLLGCFLEEQEKLLVYEYLPNRSLDKFLFDSVRGRQLIWERRYKIIEGIGRGLLYLHEDSRLRIIHLDMKASNILLDGDMNPKISDFGLAKLFQVDETQGNTNRIAGTYGYIAPEYMMHGLISTKSDVFSYGVLVLEIVTGRKNSDFQRSGHARDLLSHVWKHWIEGAALEVKDRNLGDNFQAQEVLRCIHIGLLCVQDYPSERPSMALIVLMLNNYSVTLPAPSAPAFYIRGSTTSESDVLVRNADFDNDGSDGDIILLRSISNNDVSISEIEPK